MLISPDGNRIVILSIVSFNNTCNNAFVSTSSWENIKQGMRVKLEFSSFTISKDRMTVSLFVIAKQLVSFIWKIVKLTFFSFFFYLGILSRTFTIHRTVGEGGAYLCNSSLPLSHPSQTSRHQLVDYCKELTSAHSQQPDSNREPLVSERKSPTTKLRALKLTLLFVFTVSQNTYIKIILNF